MKEDSLLFSETLFRETFLWLAENPDRDMNDCPYWKLYPSSYYDTDFFSYLPIVCKPAVELCRIDEERLKFKFSETQNILAKRRKAIQERKNVEAVFTCVYCPIKWPIGRWTNGISIGYKPFPHGLSLVEEVRQYQPCTTVRWFHKGLLYKFYKTKSLRKKSCIAKRISELPLTELGERLSFGRYENYEQVLLSYD